MKKTNMRALANIKDRLTDLRSLIETIAQDEQDAFDAKSEKWQESDKGQAAQDAVETLNNIATELNDAEDALGDIMEAEND